ncbi:MAG TPA: protein kinase, partial [Anaeromyxobacteraceae bacterium]|nr:protein kinase [Anaeromyxobacteraceae bacterium]
LQERIWESPTTSIYRAFQIAFDREVAVKLLTTGRRDPAASALFMRTARAAARLRHPNIVQVIDLGQTRDGTPFVVMEYLAGRKLTGLIQDESPLPSRNVRHIGDQILSALEKAHALQLAHGSLTPENIVLESEGDDALVKILGFGSIALSESPGHEHTAAIAADTTPALAVVHTDLQATAQILFSMLSGGSRFDPNSPPEAFFEQLAPELAAILRRGLVEQPGEGFITASEMRRALITCRLDPPPPPPPPPSPAPSPPPPLPEPERPREPEAEPQLPLAEPDRPRPQLFFPPIVTTEEPSLPEQLVRDVTATAQLQTRPVPPRPRMRPKTVALWTVLGGLGTCLLALTVYWIWYQRSATTPAFPVESANSALTADLRDAGTDLSASSFSPTGPTIVRKPGPGQPRVAPAPHQSKQITDNLPRRPKQPEDRPPLGETHFSVKGSTPPPHGERQPIASAPKPKSEEAVVSTPPKASTPKPDDTPPPQASLPKPSGQPPPAASEPEDAEGIIHVTSDPPADVYVNNRKMGRSPSTLRLGAGQYEIMFFNRTFGMQRREVSVAPGEERSLYVNLAKH